MIRSILIPISGHGVEDHVIKYVVKAFPLAKFYVVSVVNTHERGVQLTNLLYKEMKSIAKKTIEKTKNLMEKEDIKNVEYKILEGIPSKAINKYAKKKDVDLIAMRAYSRTANTSTQEMGVTIKNIIKKSTTPVLTLTGKCEKLPIKKILFSTDGTRKSTKAKNFAILFSCYYKTELEALHVMNEESKRQHAEEIVKNTEWKASFMDVKVQKSVETGDIIKKIIEHTHNNDILIIGIGRKILLWYYIGHITQALVTQSPIPVILNPYIKKRWKKRMPRK